MSVPQEVSGIRRKMWILRCCHCTALLPIEVSAFFSLSRERAELAEAHSIAHITIQTTSARHEGGKRDIPSLPSNLLIFSEPKHNGTFVCTAEKKNWKKTTAKMRRVCSIASKMGATAKRGKK